MQSFEQLSSTLASSLATTSADERAALAGRLAEVVAADATRLAPIMHALAGAVTEENAADELLQRILQRMPPIMQVSLDEQAIEDVSTLYRRATAASHTRPMLLRMLAADGRAPALARFAELLAVDPPTGKQDPAAAFVPLFQHPTGETAALFPRLFDCLENPALAAIVLDLSNYLFRKRVLASHPAAPRAAQLAGLLQGLVRRLTRIEERPAEAANSPEQLNRIVSESVALVVSLCDAIALIGDRGVAPKLYEALELHHRRVRTEAAAALLRLGDETGLATLAAMTAEPIVRNRALAYLEELGMLDRVPANRASAAARAEGALAAWLAEPAHFGLPPAELELVDARRQYWPGFDEPVDCFLFRFEYRAGDQALASVGMAGPVTHAFRCDLQDLSPDDIYAAYAGWSAEHTEISEQAADQLSGTQLDHWQQIAQQLESAGYQQPLLAIRGMFFGRVQWVAMAERHGLRGIVVVDDDNVGWYALPQTRRAPGAAEMYYIHKGRELLRAFNPEQ